MRKYRMLQSLDHLPRVRISESEAPAVNTADAPPILKMCALMCWTWGIAIRRKVAIVCRVRNSPLRLRKRGPTVLGEKNK